MVWFLGCDTQARRDEGRNTLRITIQERPDTTTLKLAGRVAGPALAELGETWRKLFPCIGGKVLVVDLQDVTFADSQGAQLLRDIYSKTGNQFLANTPLTRHLAEQASNGTARKDL